MTEKKIDRMEPGTGRLYGEDDSVVNIADKLDEILTALQSLTVTIDPGDVEIGAVEVKDAASDQRATVNEEGQVLVSDSVVADAVSGLADSFNTTAFTVPVTCSGDGYETIAIPSVAVNTVALYQFSGTVDDEGFLFSYDEGGGSWSDDFTVLPGLVFEMLGEYAAGSPFRVKKSDGEIVVQGKAFCRYIPV
jgi:hypothetical protein